MLIGDEDLLVELTLEEDFTGLANWVKLDDYGRWTVEKGGLVGEWISNSPSLFLRQKVSGDYVWQTTVTRLEPDSAFVERFGASKWGRGQDPLRKYNFNFWLRAETPDDAQFLDQYPTKLGTGWNGMGDDHWNSLYTTVVRNGEENWVRLRRSPGYAKVKDVADVVPFLPHNEPHRFTFIIRAGRVRMYFDETLVYEYEDPALYPAGHIGYCVWLCVVRFENVRLYRFLEDGPCGRA